MKTSPKSGLMRSCSTKSKLIWTSDLCDKFQKAIETLGIDNAVPKKILQLMQVEGLTRDNVASHLQKYRILQKKLAASNNRVAITSKPILLESLMTDETSWMNSSLMLNHQPNNGPSNSRKYATNPPILDTSSIYIPVVEPSNLNPTFELAYPGSLWIRGNNSMQEMGTDLDKQRSLNNDTYNLGVAGSHNYSSSGFVQNWDGFTNSYKGGLAEVESYSNIGMDSSSGVVLNNELGMTWNHEKQIITGNSKSPYFLENPSSSESHYSSQSEFVETGWMYGASSRNNMENEIPEHDLIWNGASIDYLLSCGNDNRTYQGNSDNHTYQSLSNDNRTYQSLSNDNRTYQSISNDNHTYQSISNDNRTYQNISNDNRTYQSISNDLPLRDQVAAAEDFLNNDSFDSYQNNSTASLDLHQTLDGFLHHDSDHTFNMNNVTHGPPNQDVNDQNSLNIIPFGSNEELSSMNEVQTTNGNGNLPPYDQTFQMNNVTPDFPNQNSDGQYFQDNFAFDSKEATSINEDQNLGGFLSGFDPTYNMRSNDELIEPIWSPEPITNDMIRQGYF